VTLVPDFTLTSPGENVKLSTEITTVSTSVNTESATFPEDRVSGRNAMKAGPAPFAPRSHERTMAAIVSPAGKCIRVNVPSPRQKAASRLLQLVAGPPCSANP
jgi:hypothetical protein